MATTVQNPFDTQQAAATANPATATPGLVASNLPQAGQAMTYAPQTRQVNQTTDTMQGQVNSILSKDSPLMQRARTLATQGMAQRGLVNSSMAQGAGVAAMTDRALPIAQQDANTYNQVASENMTANNTSNQFNAGQLNQFSLQSGAQKFAADQSALDRSQQTNLQTGQQTFTAAQSALERAQQVALTDKSIGAQQALQTAQQNFQGAQSALDRSQQTSLQTLQQNFAGSQNALERAQQAYLQDRSAENQMALQGAQQNFTAAQAAIDRQQQAFIQDDQQAFQTSMTQMQQSFTAAQTNLDRQQQAFLQDDAQAFQTNLTNSQIPANFALAISNTTASSVNAIAADANLSGTVDGKEPAGSSPKSRAISSALNYANSQISWANKFYGTTIPGLPTA